MTKEKMYNERLVELRPLIFAIKTAIELYGREEAKKFAKTLFDRYAEDRFVTVFKDIPLDKRWQEFKNQTLEYADDISYSMVASDETMVKINYHWCVFYEIFKDYGLGEFVPLYCETDFDTCRKIHPGIKMTRTQILADGGDCCDHCWTYKPDA